MHNNIDEALQDLKLGKIIIVCDDEARENEGDFVALAQYATVDTINFMITHGRGLLCMPITKKYAEKLNFHPMIYDNSDNFSTAFTISIDHISTTTGISAHERLMTINKVLDPTSSPKDFRRPGHVFPLIAKKNGVLERAGHTEATIDLAKLCKSKPAGIICEILNKNGTMARYVDLKQLAKKFDLKIISIKDLINYRKINNKLINREVETKLPTQYGNFNIIAYSSIIDNKEHIALIKGNLSNRTEPILLRIHSECFTGDIFCSLRCDCGKQLEKAMKIIEKAGVGIIIYLRQEGRGIGLINKLHAYNLQQKGYDTVDANNKLGFASDLRDYVVAAKILNDLKIKKVKLLTNNPEKIYQLEKYGIKVIKHINLQARVVKENAAYIKSKIEKLGHFYIIKKDKL